MRLTLFISVIAFTPALGQEAAVDLVLESRTLDVGESIDAQLVCTNTGQPELPQMVIPDGLELQVTNPTPSRFQQMSIVNGRRTEKTTFTYSLRLTGRKPGLHTLGPITVAADGSTYQTAPIQINVKPSSAAHQPDADKLVFVNVSVEPTSLFVTESFEASLVIGIRKVVIEGRVIELDNLLQFVDAGASDLSVFGTRFTPSEKRMTSSEGMRHDYVLFRTTKEIRAEEVGRFRVGPVFIKVNYPTALRRGFFGGYEASRSQKVTARADAIEVEVNGPPAEGRPADFTGAIGQYSLQVSAKPTQVEQGRPVTLAVSIGGSPLEGVLGPSLIKHAELLSRFDFASEDPTGDIEGRVKVFRRAIFPKQPGEQTIPSISWSYFDPRAQEYVTLRSEPIRLQVEASEMGSSAATFADGSAEDREPGKLTVVRGGISPIYVDAPLLLVRHDFEWSLAKGLTIGVAPPLIWLATFVGARRSRRFRKDPGLLRRKKARQAAFTRIRSTIQRENDPQVLHDLAAAFTRYVSERFDLPPGAMTPADVRRLLSNHGAKASLINEVVEFLEGCEASRYAPGLRNGGTPSDAASRVRRWIDEVERGLAR